MGEGTFSRHGRFLILSLTVCASAMIAAVWWYYQHQREAIDNAAVNQLSAIADFKTAQIANWRRERIGDGRVVAASPLMRSARRILSGQQPAKSDRADILAAMQALSREFLYSDATLVDLDGSVRIRLREDRTDESQLKQRVRRDLACEAVRVNGVVLSDLTLDTRFGRPLMASVIPVNGLGALILEIDPASFLYPYLQSWPTPSQTAETVLLRRDGRNGILALNELRHDPPGSALVSRSRKDLPNDEQLRSGWVRREVDYRGVPSLKVTRQIPDSPWYLTAKIAQSEVDAPLSRFSWEMTVIMALIALVNGSGVGLIWRNRQLQAHREREEWFRTVANDTPAYLWMASADGENMFINKPLGRFVGTDRQSPSSSWTDYLHPDDAARVRAKFSEDLAARRESADEFRLRRFDGEYRWMSREAVPRFSQAGEFLGYAGALLDLTDRRRAESQLRGLSARLIDAQEEERKRLARELHDDLNQQIAAVTIGVGNLKRHIPEELAEVRGQSDRIHQKLVHLAEAIRRMSHELHPAILQYSGLATALRTYCDEFGALARVRVSLDIDGSFDGVAPATALCIYRIAQEALRNVAKHAKVETAAIQLRREEGQLLLTVSDRGVGMQPSRASATTGLGLVSIKERTRLVGGSLEIRSQPDQGTTITVEVPA
ncbi:MAG: PAS domain S-box protein [Bryobacteraceae bacterium]